MIIMCSLPPAALCLFVLLFTALPSLVTANVVQERAALDEEKFLRLSCGTYQENYDVIWKKEGQEVASVKKGIKSLQENFGLTERGTLVVSEVRRSDAGEYTAMLLDSSQNKLCEMTVQLSVSDSSDPPPEPTKKPEKSPPKDPKAPPPHKPKPGLAKPRASASIITASISAHVILLLVWILV